MSTPVSCFAARSVSRNRGCQTPANLSSSEIAELDEYFDDAPETGQRSRDDVLWNQPTEEWDGEGDLFQNSALARKKRRKKTDPEEDKKSLRKRRKRKKKRRLSADTQVKIQWLIWSVVVFLILVILGLFRPAITFWSGLTFLAIGGFAIYAHACENDASLLFRIIPFYSIIYTFGVLSEVWHWALMQFGGIALMIASVLPVFRFTKMNQTSFTEGILRPNIS